MRSVHLKTVVKQIDPALERRRWLQRLGIVVIALGAGFLLGREQAADDAVPLQDPTARLSDNIARLETRANVDRATISELRLDLAESRARVEELERELVFYREVLAPEEQGAELVFREPMLIPGESDGAWRYQFVVQQGAQTDSVRRGDLRVAVVGERGGEVVSLSLADLDGELAADALPLNFRYFQRFSGLLEFPADFQPVAVQLQAELAKPRQVTVERSFDWPVATNNSESDQPVSPEDTRS